MTTTAPTDFREMTRALYAVVSAAPGKRDWEHIRHYYHPDARLVRTGLDAAGAPFAKVMSFDEYAANVETLLQEVSFSEIELTHEALIFGNVARLTSVYEFTWKSSAQTRQGRGVNFFTVILDGGHWKIMSIVWDNERAGLTLPQALL